MAGTKKGKEEAKSSVPVRREEARPIERQQGWGPGWRWHPWEMMRRWEEGMDRMFEIFSGGRHLAPQRHAGDELTPGMWAPRVDVFESDSQVIIKAEVPGLDPKDLEVNATEDEVVLSGETRREEEVKEEGFYRSERSVGRFYRRIPLPTTVKANQAKATYRDGVLEVDLPKTEEAKERVVKVKVES